ncbi:MULTISPECIES: ParB N-terminal domain-containing protein [Actinomycetes]|uniref:ParB/RepB/Spo0J family partition protein n=1 Tax=Actinomycetes TaxID=1760 RepID=UPI000689788E|nr:MULTISPECIES: ParB N-terminal domain-containing protein [Actinomycetes]MCK0515940.1 ParB N-terminal domain-containing protein [Williamsia sp. DF01-3]
MGNNNTATLTPSAETAATGELVHAHPAEVIIDDNVRTDATLDKAFVASIAARGVLLPVLATRDADGTLRVRDGQLRTLAAREAELSSIPVYVISSEAADDAATIERISDQLQTNEQRTQLNNTDRATAFQQLLDLGLSRTKIAKTTNTPKKTVDAALAIAGSAHAMAAVNDLLTLDQGAIIAGYEADGDTDAVTELLEAATEGRFEHKHAELVENADQRAALREGLTHWRDKGFHVSDVRPQHRSAWIEFYSLVNADTGEKVTDEQLDDLTPEHVLAFVETDYEEIYLNAAGERVEEATIDWSVQDEGLDAVAADGMVDCRLVTEKLEWSPCVTWYHNDPARDGLETASENRQRSRSTMTDVHLPGDAPSPAAGAAQDADGESAQDRADRIARERADREREREEAEKRERRKVITLNKLGVAAQKVRRDKLTEAFARKTLPKGKAAVVAAFLATTVWRNADLYNVARQDAGAKKIAAELLGGVDPIEALDGAAAERAQLIALAITCAAHEANLPKDAWRGGHEYLRSVGDARTRYLRFLTEAFGYTLSDIEKVVTGDMKADEIDIS